MAGSRRESEEEPSNFIEMDLSGREEEEPKDDLPELDVNSELQGSSARQAFPEKLEIRKSIYSPVQGVGLHRHSAERLKDPSLEIAQRARPPPVNEFVSAVPPASSL
jgi:hypothetical protein